MLTWCRARATQACGKRLSPAAASNSAGTSLQTCTNIRTSLTCQQITNVRLDWVFYFADKQLFVTF